jgi:putative inorganic carbon (HCO3(-)) transporter
MNLSPALWGQASYAHQLVGLLQDWRRGSWLMQWAEPLGAVLVMLVYGFAPFVSTDLIGILLLACAAFWVLLTVADDGKVGMTPVHLLVFLYWGISVFATALSPVRSQALQGLIKLTLYIFLFILLARILRSPRLRSLTITLYLHVALVVSVVGIRQWFFGADALATWVDAESSLAGTTRVYSYLGNPNLLAAYLLPAAFLSAAAFFTWKHWGAKALALTMFVVNSACLILTFSRGGWIGYVVAGFAMLVLLVHWFSIYLPRAWRIWALPILLGVSAAVVIVAVTTVDPIQERVASIFAGREDSSNNFRLNVWAAVQEMIADRPILGIGPGNDAFNQVYPRYQRAGYTALSAYSIFLEILVETGVVGMTCFLWLLLVTLNQGWQRIQQLRQMGNRDGFWLIAAIAILMGMLSHGLVDTVWYRPQVNTLWWLMIALITSYYLPPAVDSAAEVAVS